MRTFKLSNLPRVLVADDDPTDIRAWKQALASRCVVDTVGYGVSALEQFRLFCPTVVILGRTVSGRDGKYLLPHLRELDTAGNVLFVILAARDDRPMQSSGSHTNSVLYIPFVSDVSATTAQVCELFDRQRSMMCVHLVNMLHDLRRHSFASPHFQVLCGKLLYYATLRTREIEVLHLPPQLLVHNLQRLYDRILAPRSLRVAVFDEVSEMYPDIVGNAEFLNRALVAVMNVMVESSLTSSRIEITLMRDGAYYRIRFLSTRGISFSPSRLGRLFRFDMRSEEGCRYVDTALAREAVLRHGGELSAGNEHDRPVITLTLPAAEMLQRQLAA